ncbi:ABC transporter ATP-binding protein [Kitasatospora aureofaciens]|uniref:ABC transporter ATP-binding protein n=1 Tax=Kitasatospora aureofaciens TaxID=1894 RepID=A0A1E7NBM6_KITAU|nr:ABC transporter ATP-binding protein [Kitasatospora aureofaciens]OEV38106.1 ABC transporter ATP-binding protein [Kitasatospora aureofaciens]QEV00912.1 ABC transporter ATP-binding protein [Streptomyces viridifaciens]
MCGCGPAGSISGVTELQILDLTKEYRGGKRAVDSFTLTLRPGVLGLLGANGAGKSSLMRILATVTRPTSGRVLWEGVDITRRPGPLRRAVGYLPQDFGVYPQLTAREFLAYLAAAKGLRRRSARARIEELLELVNLSDAAGQRLGAMSGGMRQRVGIAQALLNDPALLIVDEPTVGLDPEERLRFGSLLSGMGAERIVVLSTHIVPDVAATADRIAVMGGGRLLHHGSTEELLLSAEGSVWELTVPADQLPPLRSRFLLGGTTRTPQGVRARVLSRHAPAAGARPVPPRLEDAYLLLTADRSATEQVAAW